MWSFKLNSPLFEHQLLKNLLQNICVLFCRQLDKTVICSSLQFSRPGLTSMLLSKNGKNKDKKTPNSVSNSGFWSPTTQMKSSLFTFLQITDTLTFLTRHMYRINISMSYHVHMCMSWRSCQKVEEFELQLPSQRPLVMTVTTQCFWHFTAAFVTTEPG